MIIQESQDLHTAFLNRLKAKYRLVANRSEDGKIHLSDLTHCLTASYWDRVDYEPPTDEQALAFARGWLLEDFSISDIHVEPFEVDGVWMSVDMLLDGLPGDLKSTLLAPESSPGCAVCGEPYKGHSKALQVQRCATCGHSKSDHPSGYYCLADTGVNPCGCPDFFPTDPHPYEKAPPKSFVFPVEWERRFAAYRWGLNHVVLSCTCTPDWKRYGPYRSNFLRKTGEHHMGGCPSFRASQMSTRFGVVVFHLIHAVVKAYELRWTQAELEAAWAWVLDRKAILERMLAAREKCGLCGHREKDHHLGWCGAGPSSDCGCPSFEPTEEPEPFKHNEDYECRNCAYLLRCQLWASLHPDQYKESHGQDD
jgi:hypothetical protein